MMNAAFAYAEKELTEQNIVVDETLRVYDGARIRVSNAIAILLKARFSLKPAFAIYRRLCGINDCDEYNGERMDRQNFKYTLRTLKLKIEKMELQQQNYGKKEQEDFFGRELTFNMKYLKLLRPEWDTDLKVNKSVVSETEAEHTRSSQRKRSVKRIATPPPEQRVSPLKVKSQSWRNRGRTSSLKMRTPIIEVQLPSKDNTGNNARCEKLSRNVKNNRVQTRASTVSSTHAQSKMKHVAAKETVMFAPRGRPRKRKQGEDTTETINSPLPLKKPTIAQKISQQQIDEANKVIVQKMFKLLTPQVHMKQTTNKQISTGGTNDTLVGESNAQFRAQPFLKERQQDADTSQELEKRVEDLLKIVGELEQAKKDCEAELSLVRKQLDSAQAEIKRLSVINAELNRQEVAIKRNGEYTDELKACLCHLKKAGVPDAKCGEVIISVGVLLGRRVVGDDNHQSNDH